jgi:hypothetical protein
VPRKYFTDRVQDIVVGLRTPESEKDRLEITRACVVLPWENENPFSLHVEHAERMFRGLASRLLIVKESG